jgi:hypothetical protein
VQLREIAKTIEAALSEADDEPLPESALKSYRLLEAVQVANDRGHRPRYREEWPQIVKAAGYPHGGYAGGYFSHEGASLRWTGANSEEVEVTPQGRENVAWYEVRLKASDQFDDVEVIRFQPAGKTWARGRRPRPMAFDFDFDLGGGPKAP